MQELRLFLVLELRPSVRGLHTRLLASEPHRTLLPRQELLPVHTLPLPELGRREPGGRPLAAHSESSDRFPVAARNG